MTQGHIYFIGAGPGDPELITVKGRRIIERAEVIVYAGSLVPKELLGDVSKKAVYDSSKLTLEEILEILVRKCREGKIVARVHDGDPSLYGALREQMLRLDEHKIHYTIVPGVSALFAAAARLKVELTIPSVAQTVIITRVPGRTGEWNTDSLKHLISSNSTIAFYLSIAYVPRLVVELKKYLRENMPVAVIYRATWPDEVIILGTLSDIVKKVRARRLRAHSLFIVGQALEAPQQNLAAFRSKLYDPAFSHSYRSALRQMSKVPS